MLKLRESMTARCEDWMPSRRLPFAVIVADYAALRVRRRARRVARHRERGGNRPVRETR
jgi:hypothetical protein